MKRKTFNNLMACLMVSIVTVIAFTSLSPLFHQEVPKNTIRILMDRVMDQDHIRLQPLLKEKNYTYLGHHEDFDLIPFDPTHPTLQFHLVKDENTRALIFLKGEADVLYDTLSIAKTEWVKNQRVPGQAQLYSRSGESISHLAMNTQSAVFQNPGIKNAIAEALPLKLWVETVFFNWVELLGPEKFSPRIFPGKISLNYLTTSSREGQQMAYLTREALQKIGIDVQIHIYEASLFYAKIRKREFDLYSSTSLPGTKNILDLPFTETIPLFRWKHGLILNSRIVAPSDIESQLDYSFRFLSDLHLQSSP